MYFLEKKVPDNFRAFSIKNLSAEYFLCIFRVFIKKTPDHFQKGGGSFFIKKKSSGRFFGVFYEKNDRLFPK